ncbi:hypothetical protein JCM10207_003359 [Rhodosporidiobolus poonsookiae]
MTAADGIDKISPAKGAVDSARIGWAFLSQYYSFMNKDPTRLHCFYTKQSTLIHGVESEDTQACYGQQEIHAKVMSLGFDDCKVYISNVDSQSSAAGGIIVQVIGEMSNANGPWRKFAQTFFLAEQENGYFVLNDICRYIKEEGDETDTAAAAPSADHQQTSLPVAGEVPASVQSVLFDEEPTVAKSELVAAPEEPVPVADASADSFTFHGDDSLIAPVNGVAHDTTTTEPEPKVEAESVYPTEPATPEPETVVKPEEVAAVEEAPVEASTAAQDDATPSAPALPVPAVPAPEPAAPVAPSPAAATGPKSWASLAASNVTKWGQFANQSKGVSTAAPPIPAATPAERPAAPPAAPAAPQSDLHPSVLAVNTPCGFVKGVVETVSDKALRDILTSRFGPLKELDIVRSKACAFIEFEKLHDARRAIQASLRPSDGGDGGIYIDVGLSQPARINVVERKPHDQRPVSNRTRGGGAIGAGGDRSAGGAPRQGGRDDAASSRGGRGGRGGATSTRGGRGGAKASSGAPSAK